MAALQEFRPEIWSSNLIVNTNKALVFGNLATRQYEGEITGAGSVVKISELGDITIGTYTEGADVTVQELTGAQRNLVIDQQKYFAFDVDDILAVQARPDLMAGAMQKASFAMSDNIDQYLAALYAQAGITNAADLGAAGANRTLYATGATDPNMVTMITDMHRLLDEANAPSQGRWIVVPPFMHQYLKYAQIVDNTTGAMRTPNSQAVGNGYIGMGLGFNWYASNNVSTASPQYRVMFGAPGALALAVQITKMEASRRELQFADLVKGLFVYGAKVVRPDYLGTAYIAAGGLST